MILWSIAVAAGGWVASYPRLFIARAVLGVTESPAYPTAVRVTSDWFQVNDRGVPTGVFNMGSNIGTAIGPPLLTALMLLAGWRWMFIIMGIVGIGASAAWMQPTFKPINPGGAERPSQRGNGADYSGFARLGP
jgi:MFS family permease